MNNSVVLSHIIKHILTEYYQYQTDQLNLNIFKNFDTHNLDPSQTKYIRLYI